MLLFLSLILLWTGCSKDDPAPELSLGKSQLLFEVDGTPGIFGRTVDILSNSDWTVSSDKSWCKVDKTGGSGNELLSITIEPNDEFNERTATITVIVTVDPSLKKTVTIQQDALEYELTVPTEELRFTEEGTSAERPMLC